MTPRSLRRAAERKALKLARKRNPDSKGAVSFPQQPPSPEDSSASPAQVAANRANAQFSTGPASDTGTAESLLDVPQGPEQPQHSGIPSLPPARKNDTQVLKELKEQHKQQANATLNKAAKALDRDRQRENQ